MTLVSVVIPAYNHENYIEEAIRSVMKQSYQDIELIVVDDGSKDSTWQKISALEAECKVRFSNIVFKTQENRGTCVTLNRLLFLAKGKYVLLLASDDALMPHSIQTQVDFLENNLDYVLVVGDNALIDENSKLCFWDIDKNIVYDPSYAKYKTHAQYLIAVHTRIDFYSEDFGSYYNLIQGNYVPNGYLIRKSALNNFQFTPEAPLEDWYIMLQLAKQGKLKFIDGILFKYRIHSTNTSANWQKMLDITKQTFDYEAKQMKSSSNQAYKDSISKLQVSYAVGDKLSETFGHYLNNK